MSEQSPGRYNRSFGGLIGSMIVLVVLLVVFVSVRKIITSPLDVDQTAVDYLDSVQQLQVAGEHPVYPATLPTGWSVYNVQVTPGDPPAFGLAIHTDQQRYIGVQESTQDAGSLLDQYVDPSTTPGEAFSTPNGVATTWAGWSDSGGDHAYTATVGRQTVIVFGPADVADLQSVVGSLTLAALPRATSFPSVDDGSTAPAATSSTPSATAPSATAPSEPAPSEPAPSATATTR